MLNGMNAFQHLQKAVCCLSSKVMSMDTFYVFFWSERDCLRNSQYWRNPPRLLKHQSSAQLDNLTLCARASDITTLESSDIVLEQEIQDQVKSLHGVNVQEVFLEFKGHAALSKSEKEFWAINEYLGIAHVGNATLERGYFDPFYLFYLRPGL